MARPERRDNEAFGPLIRLQGISTSRLPVGGRCPKSPLEAESFSSTEAEQPSLKTFVRDILQEAIPFIDSVRRKYGDPFEPPKGPWKPDGKPKKYTISKTPVELYQRKLAGSVLATYVKNHNPEKDEIWACRRSCHENKMERGTASWDEFVRSFKNNHPESEKSFTPACIGAWKAMSWETTGLELEVHGLLWSEVTVNVVEMTHKMPPPLNIRTFPVVQICASLAAGQEFIVVSIPLRDFNKSPYAEDTKKGKYVVGSYVAVERIRVIPTTREIEWIMATASNAKGFLPMFIQKMAVPGEIAKDVELFISWIDTQRKIEAQRT